MKFENSEQLANHVKKFCSESEYADPVKLEQKYNSELRFLKDNLNLPKDLKKLPGSNLINIGQASLDNVKSYLRSNDDEFKKLEQISQKKREEEMENELYSLKEDRQKIRLKKLQDDGQLEDLLHDLEMRKEKELRARIEKDQIRRALVDLEKTKLNTLEQDKKKELLKLSNERETLRLKEDELLDEIGKLDNNIQNMDQMRKEEINKLQSVQEGLRGKKVENRRVDEMMVQERSDKIALLKVKREQLEGERFRIMDNLEKVKMGDLSSVKKNPSNLKLMASNLLGNNHNNSFMQDRDRINQLKNEHDNMYQREFMHIDEDEMNTMKKPTRPFVDNAQKMLNDIDDRKNGDPGVYTTMREKVENINKNYIPEFSAEKALQDISVMKQNYVGAGGRDSHFLSNLENLEKFYMNNKNRQQDSMIQNNMNVSPASNNMSPEIQKQLALRENENNKLRSELEVLKHGSNLNLNTLKQGNFALTDMNMKMNGLDPAMNNNNPYEIFQPQKEFFLQNEVRSVDLSEEERILMNLQAQEVDALRVISRIPIGTELYRFKMEQFKELSTTRSEIEKIVQEQRLQRLRRDFEKVRREEDRKFDNEKWVDDQRKFIIAQRLRKDLERPQSRGERKYDPNEGLIVHWDFVLGLPRRNDFSQIVFGIYCNGTTIYTPKLVEPHDCEVETSTTNRCIYGESHQIFDTPPNPDTLMIFEVQLPFSRNVEENVGKTESYGWTQLDLFDNHKDLKRGKWKCPLYYGPTDSNITIEQIKDLEPIQNSWIYLRIAFPDDDLYGKMKSLYPENAMGEYVIPTIHLRGVGRPRPYASFDNKQNTSGSADNTKNLTDSNPPNQNQTFTTPSQSFQKPSPPQKSEKIEKLPTIDETSILMPPQKPSLQSIQPQSTTQLSDNTEKKGLSVRIYSIKNHMAKSHLRTMVAVLEGTQLVFDENGNPCAFNTSVHNPLDTSETAKIKIAPTQLTSVQFTQKIEDNLYNRTSGQDIIFQEEYKFLRNFKSIIKKNQGRTDLYLGIQVVEKPEPQIAGQNGEISYKSSAINETANYGGLEFELFGWLFFKLNNPDGSIRAGRYSLKLLEPPMRRPPIDPDKVTPHDKAEVDFEVKEVEYDEATLLDISGRNKKKTKNPKKKQEIKDNSIDKPNDVPIDNNPYIQNLKSQVIDRPFEKGMGVDFYIDGARFLPDNVTVTKVVMEVYNNKLQKIFPPKASIAELNSTNYSPSFNFRRELRKEWFDPTCLVFISIDTFDKAINEVRIVGYSVINLFWGRFNKTQPENSSDVDVILMNGAYQLPIICQEPYRNPPFDMKKLDKLERIPCASLLVRINIAPVSEDGLRTLSIEDFPDPADWEKKGLLQPRPHYGTGRYNTSLCPVRDSEKELFVIRQQRYDSSVRDQAYILIKGEGISRQMSDSDFHIYLDQKLNKTANTTLIDMQYFAKYQPEAGFKFSLDGIHNVPKGAAYAGLYCLNPPAALYQLDPNPTLVHLNSNLDWEGPLMSPRFLEGFATFKDAKFDRNICIIIDIRTVSFAKLEPVIEDVGWTILPVFSPNGFVMSGIYQIPLFKGAPIPEYLKEMEKTDPWPFLMEKLKDKKSRISYLEPTSVIVRLLDSNREGHFKDAFDPNRVLYNYLPDKKKKEYAFNQAVAIKLEQDKKLNTIIPMKGDKLQFNQKITDAFAARFNLTQYFSDI